MQTDNLKRLVTRNIDANMQLLNRAAGLLRSARDLGARSGGLRSVDAQRLYADWLTLSMDHYARLSNQSIQYLNAVVGIAEQALGRQPAAAAPASQGAQIRVSGARGQRLIIPFMLDNSTGQAVNASLSADDFVSARGAKVAGRAASFQPTAFTLAPAEQRVVEALVTLDDAFEPGETYATTLRVAGFPEREIRLDVTVLDRAGKGDEPQS